MEASTIGENTRERERLRRLVARLSDEELEHPMSDGWTVAGVLAHLAFWDRRLLVVLRRLKADASAETPASMDAGVINDAMQPLCLAIPPRAAAQLVVHAAKEVDHEIETTSPEIIARIEASPNPMHIGRAKHRGEHLDEIERALRIQST